LSWDEGKRRQEHHLTVDTLGVPGEGGEKALPGTVVERNSVVCAGGDDHVLVARSQVQG
jgi:hypothetical protein